MARFARRDESIEARGDRLGTAGDAFFGTIALGFAVVTYAMVFTQAVDVPYWDEWGWAPLILKYHAGTLTFADLWSQHNEHRILFPQLVMLWLDSFGYWSQRRECLFSVVVVTGSLWVLWRIARRTLPLRPALVVVAVGSSFLFSPSQSENWLSGFQTAWFLVALAVFGAADLLGWPRLSVGVFLAEVTLAAIAAFSSGFGLAILPAVWIGLFVRRRSFGTTPMLLWIVVSVVIVVTYLWGWQPGGSVNDMAFANGFVPRVFHTLIVTGLPLGIAGGVSASAAFGVIGIVAAVVWVVVLAREQDHTKSALAAPWVVILVYGVVSSAIIGYGRADLGPLQALSSRYITCSLMLWVGLLGLVAVRLCRSERPSTAALRASAQGDKLRASAQGDKLCASAQGVCHPERSAERRAVEGRASGHHDKVALSTRIGSIVAVLFSFVVACYLLGAWSVGARDLSESAHAYRGRVVLLANYRQASDFELRGLFTDSAFVRVETPALSAIGQLPEIPAQTSPAGQRS